MRRVSICLALLAITFRAAADPAVWVVSEADGPRLWLLGSVHYLRASDYPLPGLVDTLYRRADEIVMELDLDDLDQAEAQQQFLGAAALAPGRSLERAIGEALYGRLVAECRALGLRADGFDSFAPWFVALNVLTVGLNEAGFASEYGVERHLLSVAKADHKPISGLETLDAQIAALAGLSELDQRGLLEQTLDELDKSASEVTRLVAAWRDGDVDTLGAELTEDFEASPAIYEQIVSQRNRRWAERLAMLASGDKRYLVVVGALHLVGKDSVIEQLRTKGLKVERLAPAAGS